MGNTPAAALIRLNAVTVQQLIDTIVGQPGSSLDDVTLALQALAAGGDPDALAQALATVTAGLQSGGADAAQFQALLNALGQKPGATVADVEAVFVNMGTAIQQSIQSFAGAMPDLIRLNTKGDPSKVTIEANNLDGARIKTDVDVVAPAGGVLTVNGVRVLTVDDALVAGGGSIDQAALEAAVAAATAPLLARITALEAEVADKASTQELVDVQQAIELGVDAKIQQMALLLSDGPAATEAKLQAALDVLAGVENATVAQVKEFLDTVATDSTLADIDQAILIQVDAKIQQMALLLSDSAAAAQLSATTVGEKLQQVMDVLARRTGATVEQVGSLATEMDNGFNELSNLINAANDTIGQVVEWAVGEFPTKLDLAALQAIVDALTTVPDLSGYAKLTDTEQVITAKSAIVDGIKFGDGNGAMLYMDDEFGNRLRLVENGVNDPSEVGIVVVHHDLADLVPPVVRDMLPPPSKDIPPDIDWTVCPLETGGSGKVEVRLVNGTAEFRGEIKRTHAGEFVTMAKLPKGFPQIDPAVTRSAFAWEHGVGYRTAYVRFVKIGSDSPSNGRLNVCTLASKITDVSLSGLQFPVVTS